MVRSGPSTERASFLPCLALILGAVCTLSLVSAAAAGSIRTAARSAYLDGDSLAVGTGWYLPRYLPGWTLHERTAISRHVSQGVRAVEARGRSLEHVVAIDLGTNDDPSAVGSFRSYVERVVRAAGPTRCVIWSTINRPPYNGVSYGGYNRALASLARTHSTLHVFDWAGMAHRHPEWFGSNGVHPNMAGYRARAAALARLIKAC
jgi:lysophospholipase L1-like esterase